MGGQVRIRKLTPTECYKLMGFTAEDCLKVKNGLNETFYKGKDKSSAQLYKQAGNSIVVNVLEEIFKSLGETYTEFRT
jgi:DNA (cytosine-5)-methyltransferase 1